ncbi:brain-enriched guanylate kinase-associated protein isoform X2 [Puntigrus tetrazona]|nr:brain-enriched guanylate kinase-associated protein isoform X2 [Puntigrus tetrazona]
MEEKIHRMTQHHEEEKRSMSREIGTLKNHLMEAKITIQKLREDNDLYRKDCNLAAQLLQCGKSPYRAHKLSELPADLQERVSSHMERQGCGWSAALRHSYLDAVPTAVIGRVLEKPEPGRSCPVTRSPSPQVPAFPDKIQRHAAYKSSDLYCSDTALYCPTEERRRDRWSERRQSADQSGRIRGHESTDESFLLHEDPSRGFVLGSLPISSCYSSCSTASDEKLHGSSLRSDWRDGDYEHKNLSSYAKEHPEFPKSSSFQHVGSQSGRSGDRRILIPADLADGWRQMSMEDISRFSPFRFSEHQFKVKPGPLYSSFQDGDSVFHRRVADPRFPASAGSSPALNPKSRLNALKAERGLMFRSKDSTSSFFITGNIKDKENVTKNASQRDYADESPSSSVESLNQGLDVHKYKDLQNPGAQKMTPRHQQFGNAGLSRKDSLTKAQLYGTLLN